MRRWIALAETLEGGGVLVGRAMTFTPQQENLESISVGVAVHPAHRGQGIATALVEEALLPAIEQSGRTLVEACGEIEAGVDPADPAHPVHRIAARLGVTPQEPRRVPGAAAAAGPRPARRARGRSAQKRGEYRIEQWVGEIPEEHLSAYGRLLTQLEIDRPDEGRARARRGTPPSGSA